jgi:von Willebrand factor type A domain.
VLFVLILPLLLGFVALAVDVVYAFMVKAALVTAVDASALAGARAIVNGQTAVGAAVDRTFHANLPSNYIVTGTPLYTLTPIAVEADGSRSITVTGTARSPSFFMGVLGYSGWDVRAYAKGGRRDINIMLVLDRSGSLVDAGAWDDVQAAAGFFVQQFDDAHDKVGLVGFGTNSKLDYSPQTSFKTSLVSTINNMQSRHGNATNSALGLYLAYDALRTLNDTSRENVMVLFTDGNSSAFPAQFDVDTAVGHSPRCTSTPKDGVEMSDPSGYSIWGIVTLQPTSAPGIWPTPDYSDISGCTGMDDPYYGVAWNGPLLVTRFRDTWIPPIGSAAPVPVSIYNSVHPSVYPTGTLDGGNILNITENMLLNVAQSARQDPLTIRIMVIGLGASVNTATLQRVANAAPYTVSGQRVGLYVYAPTSTQLMDAFRQVASSISHLIQ